MDRRSVSRSVWWRASLFASTAFSSLTLHPFLFSRRPSSLSPPLPPLLLSSSSFVPPRFLLQSSSFFFSCPPLFPQLSHPLCTYSSRCLVSRFNVRVRRSGLMYPSLQKSWRCKRERTACVSELLPTRRVRGQTFARSTRHRLYPHTYSDSVGAAVPFELVELLGRLVDDGVGEPQRRP